MAKICVMCGKEGLKNEMVKVAKGEFAHAMEVSFKLERD